MAQKVKQNLHQQKVTAVCRLYIYIDGAVETAQDQLLFVVCRMSVPERKVVFETLEKEKLWWNATTNQDKKHNERHALPINCTADQASIVRHRKSTENSTIF